MNAQSKKNPGPPPTPPSSRLTPQDYEFLPAALEILETPLSPARAWFMRLIAMFAVAAVCWAYVGRIDIVSVMQGKVQPTGRVKVVQPVEGGKIRALMVANGTRVTAGTLVAEMDTAELTAERAGLAALLASYRGEALRHRAALDFLASDGASAPASVAPDDSVPISVRARENLVLQSDMTHVASQRAGIEAQIRQKQAEQARLGEMIDAQKTLLATIKQRVSMREELLRRNSGTSASVTDAREGLLYQQTTLASLNGQRAEAAANIEVLQRELKKITDAKIAEHSQKRADAERNIDDFVQRLAKVDSRIAHAKLYASVDGIVSGLSVSTQGQVVSAGEEIMRLVPEDQGIEIESYAENKDIGFLSVGQVAIIKIESFPFTRYGTIEAKITRIASDAIPQPDAQLLEGNVGKNNKPSPFAGAQRMQNLVFAVTLQPQQTTLSINGAPIQIAPGMAITAEVKTGSRRIIDFLFSPLIETASTALKER